MSGTLFHSPLELVLVVCANKKKKKLINFINNEEKI